MIPPPTQPVGTSGSYSTLVEADDFIAENVTFENTAGEVGQAVALRTTGRRQAFYNCRMLGWQDTLYVHEGSAYFRECYVEGRVDFIFGRATAVFERCHIHSKNGGYVTAAATAKDDPFGFVFLDCKLTGDGAPAYLGRPWRDHAAVAFVRCELGEHVRPEGWDNWRNPAREKTARYAEYKCTGPGADRSKRVPWSRELSDAEAAKYTVANILGPDFPVQAAGKRLCRAAHQFANRSHRRLHRHRHRRLGPGLQVPTDGRRRVRQRRARTGAAPRAFATRATGTRSARRRPITCSSSSAITTSRARGRSGRPTPGTDVPGQHEALRRGGPGRGDEAGARHVAHAPRSSAPTARSPTRSGRTSRP